MSGPEDMRQVGWYCETNFGDADYGKHKHGKGAGWCSRGLTFDAPCAKAVPIWVTVHVEPDPL